MIKLKELLNKPEYKWLDEYKDRLCFITLGGSHAYGTNVETSDIDIRGVMLPTKEELIGLKHFEQRLDEETDSCIYEFNKFVRLAANCNPNVIELLGCREYLVFNEVGQKLLDNVNLFLSKRCINTFSGYAIAQLRRLENALCHDSYSPEKQALHIKQTMDNAINNLSEKNKLFKDGCIKPILEGDQLYLDVHINKGPIDLVRSSLNDILTIEKTYNKLNARNNKKDEAHLNKHIMHLVRLYYTCFDLLEGKVKTFREERDFLLEIRKGKFLPNNQLTEDFYPFLNELQAKMDKKRVDTILPDKPNYKELEQFILDVNSKVITNTVIKYEEPLEVVLVY